MSDLTENPDTMLEVLAVLVRRAGGSVTIAFDEGPRGPFDILSKWEANQLHLVLDEPAQPVEEK